METILAAVPDYLIKEVINGKKYYYKNYRNVLEGKHSFESIMGSSELQSTLVFIICFYLGSQLDRKNLKIVVSEPGLHLATNNNFSNDIAIYRKKDLPPQRDQTKYFSVAPLIAIEVDINIEAREEGADDFSYMFDKSRQMIAAGTEKVVWVLSRIHSLVIFTSDAEGDIQPRVIPWIKAYEILPQVSIHLALWLESEGEEELLK